MPVDFSILQRAPTIGQGILAGQQRGRERELQNRLLARQDLQFQQQQEDRARQLQQTQQQEAIFKQASDMIRQADLDPDDPQVLQQFIAAAVQSRQPQLISLANTMFERATKRREAERRRTLAAQIMGGDVNGAGAAAPVAAAAPAAMTQPPAAPAITATTFDEGAARPEMPRPSIAARTAGVEPPMPMGPVRELPPPNALAPAGPAPVNTLVAAPSAAQPAKPAAASKVDVAALESSLEKLEQRHTQLLNAGLDKEATVFYNSKIKPLERRIDKLRPKEYAPTELERLNAAMASLPPGSPERKVYEARIARLTEPSKGVTVEMPIAIYDPDTKTVKYVPRAEAVGKTPASAAPKPKDSTVSEQQAATATARLLRRSQEISTALQRAPQAEAPSATEAALQTLPGLSAAANLVRPTDRQIVASAQDDILDALLYLATGAAYNKEQLQQQKSAYLPGWSDDPPTRAVKRQRLVDMIRDAKIRAGNAWTPELDAQLNLLLESPAMKATAPTARGRVGGEATSVKLPDGRVMNFPDAAAAAAFKKDAGL